MLPYNKDNFIGDNGNYVTQSLFREMWTGKGSPVFTLGDEDKVVDDVTLVSLKKIYLEMEDIHEYEFATKYLAGWKHWQAICNSNRLRLHVDEWRSELELKMRSKAMKQMKALALDGDKIAVKYIADKGWAGTKRGRPSKQSIEDERKFQAQVHKDSEDDYARIVQ